MTLPARTDSLALLRHIVRGFRDPFSIEPDAMDDIVLAISEAATNVVLHAYGDEGGSMTIFARADRAHLRVLVRDRGRGIARSAGPRPGHGLGLVEHVATTLEISRGRPGTDILMTFDLMSARGRPPCSERGDRA